MADATTNVLQVPLQNLPSTSTTVVVNGVEGERKEEEEEDDDDEEEENFSVNPFGFDLLSPPNPPFTVLSKIGGDFGFTAISESEQGNREFAFGHSDDHNFFSGPGEEEEEEDDEEQMNFVTDLFGTHEGSPNGRNFIQSGSGGRIMDDEEPELILGLGSSSTTITSMTGLRLVGMDSESDSEAMEVDPRVDHGGLDQNDDLGSPSFWDCLYDGQREMGSFTDEFDWEEVNIRENLISLIDRIEQLSVPSFNQTSPFVTEVEEEEEIEGEVEEEENSRNVEWQVLLAVNNNLDLGSGYDEYNVQFGELVGDDTANQRGGSPPAAKSVVESLPTIALTMADLEDNNVVVCAVCKDDIPAGVNVTKLPCLHHYHKDCILPWLAIRNTCPLCRHELPTDDVDYETRKNDGTHHHHGRRTALLVHDDYSLIRYNNYQLLP